MDKKTLELYELCIESAFDADCPKDQVEQLLSVDYIPYPWQWNFHAAARAADHDNGPTQIGLGGARGPGKSHAVLSQVALDDCQRMPGLKVLFLRQTGIAAKESFEDLIDKTIRGRTDYRYVNNTLKFPNRSRVLLGGFHTEKDIDKYVGIEYDLIVIEELNQLTEEKYIKLRGSLRTSKPDWRPRIYASFNPGGVGHGFVKKTFVDPHREGIQHDSRFVPSTYKENPALNKEYIEYLESLEGDLGRAWREGEWDLFAGQFFGEWRYNTHVCQPFPIPNDWRLTLSLDYGYRAPSSVGWHAIGPDKRKYRYRELYQPGLTYSQVVDEIFARTPDDELWRIYYLVADPAIWQKKGESENGLSGAEIMLGRWKQLAKERNKTRPTELKPIPEDLVLKRGNNDRNNGWARMREALKPYLDQDGGATAEYQVFSTCTETIRVIPAMVHDEHRVEDLDTDQEDHIPDEIRYFLMDNPQPTATSREKEDILFKVAMDRKRGKKLKQQLKSSGRVFRK